MKKYHSLVKSPSFTDSDKNISARALQKLLDEINGVAQSPKLERALDSPESVFFLQHVMTRQFSLKKKLFLDKLSHPNWKKVEDKKRVSVYTLKTEVF